jgi:hypothetical protein
MSSERERRAEAAKLRRKARRDDGGAPAPPLADYLLEIPTSPEPVDEIERIRLNVRDTGV